MTPMINPDGGDDEERTDDQILAGIKQGAKEAFAGISVSLESLWEGDKEAELALLLKDYMKDGKVDFEKLDADSKPMDEPKTIRPV
jgi:hypothetical protein